MDKPNSQDKARDAALERFRQEDRREKKRLDLEDREDIQVPIKWWRLCG